jgi:hypothetical protein
MSSELLYPIPVECTPVGNCQMGHSPADLRFAVVVDPAQLSREDGTAG